MMRRLACLLLWAWPWAGAHAAGFEAVHLPDDAKIEVDGRLDEPFWQTVPAFERFWQYTPTDHLPPPVRTSVRIAYTKRALLVGVMAHDPDFAKVSRPIARRDNVTPEQDYVTLYIDPVGNRSVAQIFSVSARGVLLDGLFNESTQGKNLAPDFEYMAVVAKTEYGWSAEFSIPFSSMRLRSRPGSRMNLVVLRNYPRDQRYRIVSADLTWNADCFLCFDTPIEGIGDVAHERRFDVTGTLAIRNVRERINGDRQSDNIVKPGVDLKYSLGQGWVIDATLKPDFSQVELDQPQVSANTRFALFYPEKRPFFLEGSDILETPIRLINTRGLVSVDWGLRSTYRANEADGTMLVARDAGGGLVLLPSAYTTDTMLQTAASTGAIGRYRGHWNDLMLGALVTEKRVQNGSDNSVVAVDASWNATPEHRLRAQLAASRTNDIASPRTSGSGHWFEWSYKHDAWSTLASSESLGSGFRADLGFVPQVGYRREAGQIAYRKPLGKGGDSIDYTVAGDAQHDEAGRSIFLDLRPGLAFNLQRNTVLTLQQSVASKQRLAPDAPLERLDQTIVMLTSNPFSRLSNIDFTWEHGDRPIADLVRMGRGDYGSIAAKWVVIDGLELNPRIARERARRNAPRDEPGSVDERLFRLLAIAYPRPDTNVRLIWQSRRTSLTRDSGAGARTESSRRSDLSVVLAHQLAFGRVIYVGFTRSSKSSAPGGSEVRTHEAFAKLSWLL